MTNFLAELKRRKVIRVALAYAVVAWFIIQAADILLGNFGAPDWVFKSFTALLALGLPLALFLSWAYDLTPNGIQKTPDAEEAGTPAPLIGRGISGVLVVGLSLMALAAAYLTFWLGDEPGADQPRSARSSPGKRAVPAAQLNPQLRLSIPMPDGLEIVDSIAIARDGSQIAFSATDDADLRHVYLRGLDAFELIRIEGSRDGRHPFFSADGTAVGFYARGAIWRASTGGGPPTHLGNARSLIGADWMDDGTIAFSTGVGSAIQRMSSDGELLEPITDLGYTADYAHVWPQRVPGTDQLLFTVWRGGSESWGGAHIANIGTGAVRPLSGSAKVVSPPARWSASGHVLLEGFQNGLFATPFDPASDVSAPPGGASPLLGQVHHLGPTTRSIFALADNGTMAYVPAVQGVARLVRIQPDGSSASVLEQSTVDYATLSHNVAISSDGRQALLGGQSLVLLDLVRKLPRRLTFDGSNNQFPVWSPDEREVYFRSNRQDRWKVWKLPIDGSVPPELLIDHEHNLNGFSIGPKGEIAFVVEHPESRGDIWIREPAGDQRAILQTTFNEEAPAISPDGRFLAHVSDVSGNREVYILPASGQGLPVQVSSDGGSAPKWSRDGGKLMYRRGRAIMQVAVENGRPVGDAMRIFAATNLLGSDHTYDMDPDGLSMLAVQVGDEAIPREIRVITHFFDEIRRVAGEGRTP